MDVGNKDGERFIDYSIFGEFSDISGEPWEITFDFPIDLHKYDSKVKQMVMKYLEDVLFGKTEPATINQKSQAA